MKCSIGGLTLYCSHTDSASEDNEMKQLLKQEDYVSGDNSATSNLCRELGPAIDLHQTNVYKKLTRKARNTYTVDWDTAKLKLRSRDI